MQIEELKYTCNINIFVLFINPSSLKKTAEHRKTVLQWKKALEEKKAAVPFSEIEGDKSDGNLLATYDCSSSWKSLARLLVKKHTVKSKLSCFAWDMAFDLIIEKQRKRWFRIFSQLLKPLIKCHKHTSPMCCSLKSTSMRVLNESLYGSAELTEVMKGNLNLTIKNLIYQNYFGH